MTAKNLHSRTAPATKLANKQPALPYGAGLFPRLGAWLYDFLIVMALEMVAVALAILALKLASFVGVSFDAYVDVSQVLTQHPIISPIFTCYVFAVAVYFYGYFWVTSGQTLGMKAWKLKIINEQGGNITPTQALIRMATSCLGLGNLFVAFDRNKRAFQDHFAHTQLVKK